MRTEITQQWASREKQIKETGKGHVKIKAHLTCKTGEKKWFEIKSSIVKELHIIAFVDIDSDVMLQEKLRKNNLNNDRMLTILGHDLRSPIANLISISSLGEQSEISQQEFISMMKILKVESIEALQLLDTTFSWARLNFNDIQYRKVRIDFDELINNALKVNKATYENKSITIAVDIEKLNAIEDDLEILTTIVRNILSNAIKFTSENGLISIKALENELIITDNGIGMSTEMLDAVLSQNYRSRRGTNNEKGIGLGLRLVLTLAEKINCRIIIASTVLVGTSVRIIFDTPRH